MERKDHQRAMSTLPPYSAKRLREIADGTRNRDGSKKITAADIQARRGSYAKKVADILGGKKPAKKEGKTKAKAAADKWFSKFIRLRDADEFGVITCITSGRRMHWSLCDCGHWISRAKMAVRYDERNANAQSKQANRFQGGHFLEHGMAIDRKHGAGTREALELKAMRPCKMTEADLLFIAETYKARVKNIEEQSPGKFRAAA